ncbi:MAG TPA: bifunctional 5,10-methylenetetrahydrofolate dehydrogenase/5,10-methenyltetrahydrofolate cyclohydrolase, partial [bacterium]|nr:bifunctional 5,10-methylenetetrahydrofolate dehydrogenase/5,10-methenyltetrahydrofolate cyclohydrolase [bacterium]
SDSKCHGIFIAMPLPTGFDPDQILLTLDAHKDVEGIHPASLGLIVLRKAKLIPPTAYAALALIEYAANEMKCDLRGMKAVMIGQSAIVGRPLQLLLGERRVTTMVCNTGTALEDLKDAVAAGQIVVACAGQPGMIKGEWIRPGAIVIDVGTTEVNGKLAGDVEFEEAKQRAAFITPVPGGVGPLTVTMLMQNLINAYKWQYAPFH